MYILIKAYKDKKMYDYNERWGSTLVLIFNRYVKNSITIYDHIKLEITGLQLGYLFQMKSH